MTLRPAALLASLLALAASTGCSDDGGSSQGGGGTGGAGTGPGAGGAVPEGCIEIVQEGDTLFPSVGVAAFAVSPSSAGPTPELVVVSPESMGPVPLGTHELIGLEGEMLVLGVEDAVVDLINAPANASDGRILAGVSGEVRFDASPAYGTIFMGRVSGALTNVTFRELDAANDPLPNGVCWFLRSATFDNAAFEPDCDAPVDLDAVPSGGACLANYVNFGHSCNPVTNEGCEAGEVCDLGGVQFECYDAATSTEALCAACDNNAANGPLCQAGMTCDGNNQPGVCHRYCCTDADCGASGTCVAYDALRVGVCLTQ